MVDALMTLQLHQVLLIGHIVALIISFGVALGIELLLVRSLLSNRTSAELVRLAEQSAQIMAIAFLFLWSTGLGFFFYHQVNSPGWLLSGTAATKILIVAVLTLNCAVNQRFVLPTFRKYSGRHVLANATQTETLLLAAYMAVSLVSWVFPLLISFNPALNDGYSMMNLLGQYVLMLAFVTVVACATGMKLRDRSRSVSLLSYHGTAAAQGQSR